MTVGYRAIFFCLIFAAIAGAQAPDAPVLLSPLNGATGVSTAAALVWSAANNAASYDVYFGPSYPPPFVTNTTGISYDPGTLGASPKYYWQVVARNTAGTASSALFSFTTQPASILPFTQQGGKLVGNDVVGEAHQGPVALSADGNTAIVGGPSDNCDDATDDCVGAAWIYTRSGGVWTQQGSKLVPNDGGRSFGASVALSADGNTALVGGPYDNDFAGAAWVFTRSGGVWTQQGSKLVGNDAAGAAWQGASVALSADGNTAIVGGPLDNSDWEAAPDIEGVGATWVFTRSVGVWTQQGGKLVGSGASANINNVTSVALSADGSTALVGEPKNNGYAGAVWVFTRSEGVWTQQGGTLAGNDAVADAEQGISVALSADGVTAIVGGDSDSYGTGAAWVYTQSGGVWTQQGSKLVGTGAIGNAQQGYSVALSADGNTAIVGGLLDNGYAGAAWLYTRSEGVWTQQGGKLEGADAVGILVYQGSSVALSADGNTAMVGGPCDNNYIGAAWVFVAVPGGPVVSTSPAGFINANNATLPGSVNPNGSDTQVWFLYSTNSSMSGALATTPQDIGSGTAAVSVVTNLTGLAANTPYYFQAVAQNSAGTVQGWALSFATTTSPPTASTSAATSIGGSGATLPGSVNPNGADTHVWFLYSTNSSMSGALSTSSQDIGSGTAAVPVSAGITGLTANTSYYFQVVAQNSAGVVQGVVLNFATTGVTPPTVSTSAATAITDSGATVGGHANPNGTDTRVWFLYSTDSSMSGALSTPPVDIGSAAFAFQVTAAITGLNGATPYYFQIVAENSVGTIQGSVLSFATTPPPPVATTMAATPIAYSSATLRGSVDPNGTDTLVWFLYSTNASMTGALSTPSQDIGSGTVPAPLSANLAGLAANTPYYFQIVAQNGGGSVKGSVLSFSTTSFTRTTMIGTYNAGQWYLDANGNGTFDGAPPDVAGTFGAGLPGAIPVLGDWNATGRQKMGVFYQGVWYLDFIGNGTWDGGVIDKQYSFGWNDPNVIPVVGDWNGDGRAKIGVYYQGSWYLDYDGNGVWDGGFKDKAYNFGWAATGVTPMVGDWSGSGTAKIGIYYNGIWYLDYDGNGVWDGGFNDKAYNFGWAATGVTPIMGDWNGDGRTKIGIYYNGFWYLDYNGNGSWDDGVQDKAYNFGWSGATPVVGDWSGSGTAKIGVFYNGYWYLDYIGNGVWDGGAIDKAYVWGGAGDTPVVGRW
jgi:hypothetical protein